MGTRNQGVLPLNNPLRIAEEVATVDHINGGRFDFGIGRSGSARAYNLYGILYGESQARFSEALAIIMEAWKGERFSYQGQFYQFNHAMVSPRPHQLPHPPTWMAATTEETVPQVAKRALVIWPLLLQLVIGLCLCARCCPAPLFLLRSAG